MDHARVVHFEDDDNLAATYAVSLELFSDDRHAIVGRAADLAGSLAMLDEIADDTLKANVVLLDGNLAPGDESGSDARAVRDRIAELALPVRVVGNSSHPMEEIGVEVDADLPKYGGTVDKLIDTLDELPDPDSTQ